MAQLKLIATSDLHGELRDFDYVRGRNDPSRGLSRAAGFIDELRAEADASVLLDAGDFLFGRPYADLPDGGATAVIEAMNAVGYDVLTIGNHEFDMGAEVLERALDTARMPVISASILRKSNGAHWRPTRTIIERDMPDGPIRIGVTGVLPHSAFPVPIMLERAGLVLRDAEAALREAVADLRADGADIVVVLCHEGVSRRNGGTVVEPLALIGGIDAIVLGHLHDVFPGPNGLVSDTINPSRGSICGVPTVMPGFRAQHLGCIDLSVKRVEGQWRVTGADVDVHSVQSSATKRHQPNALSVLRASQGAHANALRLSREVIGTCVHPLHTFFSYLGTCRATNVSAEAKRTVVHAAMVEAGCDDAPVVGLAAPILSGGYGGPWDYVDIVPGPVTRGDVQRLAPYADQIVGVRACGADLRLWLERSVSVFSRIIPGEHSMRLVDSRFPPTCFDIPAGATFEVDLSRPALFDARGIRVEEGPGRIRDLRIGGRLLEDSAPVVLATTHHRRSGGGQFPIPDGPWIETGLRIDRAIEALLATEPDLEAVRTFRFTPLANARAVFETSPRSNALRSDVPIPDAMWLSLNREGFQELIVPLDSTG
ncbi:2',3'-cyclic-nucleotide 2'-phosphodiesterase / 3'-nucleotidase [Palleronia marisminoris]|uniref:Trifunctional nucleotide phosphoesterase protein YfkN n=1 Tax=Palleronia marisminoris TaxID=315423 RepID=A0A1Y5STK5_9RHOB|nr:metallophosphoesterase [Palleronia marisminoris]SFG98259.1 2',3'-cyclic-nucleotide 2'-phosphodiesterase / 3'-nucleotidase [Palleronia marisminoris]SLN48008.1 Trifunctional nucleotide phosphoesterase protein YfkN precursor [Palleronia marisminoris]